MLKYSSLSFLRAAVFSHRLYVDNALNHRALAQQLSMKLTISLLLKNTIDFFFFFWNINSMDSRKVLSTNLKI